MSSRENAIPLDRGGRSRTVGAFAIAIAFLSLAIGGCTTSHATGPARASDATSTTTGTDGAAAPSDTSSGGAAKPSTSAPASPIALVTSDDAVFTLGVVDIRRDGDMVTLDFTITEKQGAEQQIVPYSMAGSQSAHDNFSGVSLVDTAGAKRYLAVLDTAGNCMCSSVPGLPTLETYQPVHLYAQFPALPAGVSSVEVDVPSFAPVPNVPVSGS